MQKKPTYRITANFGDDIGDKVTVGAFKHYTEDDLVGFQILEIINVGTRKMGPELSGFLLLGAPDENGEAVPLTVFKTNTPLGGQVF